MTGGGGRARRLLLIGGSLRAGSTNAAVLRVAAESVPLGVVADQYEGLSGLPHFNPDDDVDPPPPAVVDLRGRIGAADAVLLSTPEYAGALPGSFKNLLDWTVGGMELDGKRVAWINCSTAPMGGELALRSLRTVLGYVGASVVEAACQHLPVPRPRIDAEGRILDPELRRRVRASVIEVLDPATAT